jgi:hypothetical protein
MAKLDPIVSEFSSDEEAQAYDKWFRGQVEAGLKSEGPWYSHEQVMRESRQIIENAKNANRSLGG